MDPNQDRPNQPINQQDTPNQPGTWNQPPASNPTPPVEPVTQETPPPLSTQQPVAETSAATPQQPVPQSTPPSSKGLSIAALVVGISAFVTGPLGLILGPIALVLGVLSLTKHRPGKGLAIAGVVLGGLSIIGGGLLLAITLTAYNGIQQRAASSANYETAYSIAEVAQTYNSDIASTGDSFARQYPSYDELVKSDLLSPDLAKKLHAGNGESVTKEKPIAYESCDEGGTFYYYTGSANAKSFTVGFPEKC